MLEPPVATPEFTTALIWPELLDADPAMHWLRALIVDEAGRLAGVEPVPVAKQARRRVAG